MKLAEAVSLVHRLHPNCDGADRSARLAMAADARRLISWAESRLAHAVADLESVSTFPERELADATRTSMRDATRVLERSSAIEAMPAFGDALADGAVTGAHVDLVGRALRALQPALQPKFVEAADRLAVAGSATGLDDSARLLRREVRRIEADDGIARLERQRRNTSLRTWVDDDGMYRLSAQFDPVTGATLAGRLDSMVATLFADTASGTAPADPVLRQHHLRALALVALTEGRGAAAGRPELLVVVDAARPDDEGAPTIDWGIPVEVPMRVVSELSASADVRTVVVRNGVVLHAPGTLALGRTSRVANRAQRRVLRAFHPTCAVGACSVPFAHCKIHHLQWWRHGGATDLHNLVPVCEVHHHRIHDDGWGISLLPDRTVVTTLPDGTCLRSTGPPGRKSGAPAQRPAAAALSPSRAAPDEPVIRSPSAAAPPAAPPAPAPPAVPLAAPAPPAAPPAAPAPATAPPAAPAPAPPAESPAAHSLSAVPARKPADLPHVRGRNPERTTAPVEEAVIYPVVAERTVFKSYVIFSAVISRVLVIFMQAGPGIQSEANPPKAHPPGKGAPSPQLVRVAARSSRAGSGATSRCGSDESPLSQSALSKSSKRARLRCMTDRMLTEREAFRAARYFLKQFNERERSESLMLLIGWMEEGTWSDPRETADPAQWHDWVASVDRVLADRGAAE